MLRDFGSLNGVTRDPLGEIQYELLTRALKVWKEHAQPVVTPFDQGTH